MIEAVYFDYYCPKCVHEKKLETEEPCCDCLEEFEASDEWHKPIFFEETAKAKKEREERSKR